MARSLTLARRTIRRALLRDRVRITGARWVGQGTVNPVTFEVTFPEPAELYDGPGLVRRAASTLVLEQGGDYMEADELTVTIPAGTPPGITPGCLVLVIESADWALIGQEFEVRSVEDGSGLITRRLQVRRLQSYPSVGGS